MPVLLLDLTGSGTKTTEKFQAPADWDLAWSYDCTGQQSFLQLFQVFAKGPLVGAVNQTAPQGNGVEHYHEGGETYLVVNTACPWHVTASG